MTKTTGRPPHWEKTGLFQVEVFDILQVARKEGNSALEGKSSTYVLARKKLINLKRIRGPSSGEGTSESMHPVNRVSRSYCEARSPHSTQTKVVIPNRRVSEAV